MSSGTIDAVEDKTAQKNLARAAKAYDAARIKERLLMTELYGAIAAYCEAGGSEMSAAKLAGVDRMTVRRAVGKL